MTSQEIAGAILGAKSCDVKLGFYEPGGNSIFHSHPHLHHGRKLVRTGYGEYQMVSTVPGQADHDAEAWWLSTVKAVREAIHDVPADQILAIGIGCTNGLVAVNHQGRPLRPAIMLWDQRALPEVDRIRNILDADTVFNITGNPVAPGAYSLPTILWLKHHEPETFHAAYKLMVPGGYLVARFTGEFRGSAGIPAAHGGPGAQQGQQNLVCRLARRRAYRIYDKGQRIAE